MAHTDDEDETLSEDDKDECMQLLKHCVFPDDRKKVEKALKDTKNWRRALILRESPIYRDVWQFYTLCAPLVCHQFVI